MLPAGIRGSSGGIICELGMSWGCGFLPRTIGNDVMGPLHKWPLKRVFLGLFQPTYRSFSETSTWRIIPGTCKSLITMVIVSPLSIGLWDPFQMVTNHLLTGMILQVVS